MLENKLKDIIKQILIIILYIFLSSFLTILLVNTKNFALENLSLLAVDLIILVIFLFLFRNVIVPDADDFKKNSQKYIRENIKYWLIGLAIMLVSNIIISSFLNMPSNEEANRALLESLPIYSTITMVIISPIIEELMTRVILKNTFKNHYIYYFLSALIFGSLHIIVSITSKNYLEILYIIPYGALGYSFAVMYDKSNNVWTNIFFHSLHNLMALLIIFIGWLLCVRL